MGKILLVMSDHSPLLSVWWWGKTVRSDDLQYLFVPLFLGRINDDTFILLFPLRSSHWTYPREFYPLLTGRMRQLPLNIYMVLVCLKKIFFSHLMLAQGSRVFSVSLHPPCLLLQKMSQYSSQVPPITD